MSDGIQESRVCSAARLLQGPWGWLVGVAWGFAEGSFFFVVPDVLISFVALFSWRASGRHLVAVVGGSLLAGALLFGLSSRVPEVARSAVIHVPLVRSWMFGRVGGDFADSGVWALCRGPSSGIPYKVYAVEAPGHVELVPFLLVSVPARLERILSSWLLFAAVGGLLRKRYVAPPGWALAGFLSCWIILYSAYVARIVTAVP